MWRHGRDEETKRAMEEVLELNHRGDYKAIEKSVLLMTNVQPGYEAIMLH
jgi:hypothetical protein